MVINKFGDRLYNGLVQTQTEHLRVVAAKIEAAQGESFLRELKLRWDHHNKSMQMIRDILMVSRRCISCAQRNSFLLGTADICPQVLGRRQGRRLLSPSAYVAAH